MKHLTFEEIIALMDILNREPGNSHPHIMANARKLLYMAAMYSEVTDALNFMAEKEQRWPMNETEIFDHAKMLGWKGQM